MNQPRQILKNTAVLTVSDLADRAANAFLALFVSRILHATGLGVYAAALAYHGLIARAGAMGATSFLVREIAKDRSRTSRYVTHLNVLGTVASVVMMAVGLLVLPYLPYSDELATSMRVVILAIIPGALKTIQRAVFIAHQRVEFVTYTTLVSKILSVSASLWLLACGYGVVGLVVVFVIEQYLVVICYFYLINRFITPLHWEFELSFGLTLIREVKTFAALSILAGLFAQPEVILLSLLSNEAAVGFYSAALKVVNLWHFIPQIAMTNVFPVLSRSYHLADRKSRLIQEKSIKYLLVISLPLTAGTIAVSEPIIGLLYGPGFGPSVAVLRVLAWSIPLSALISVFWRVLAARNQQGLDLRARMITIFARIGSGCLLISPFASLGAAMTATASLLLNTLLLARYVKLDGTKLHLLRLGWRCALAALGMGVVAWSVRHQLPLWALVPLAAAIYVLQVLLFKVFSRDDIALFRKTWQPEIAERS